MVPSPWFCFVELYSGFYLITDTLTFRVNAPFHITSEVFNIKKYPCKICDLEIRMSLTTCMDVNYQLGNSSYRPLYELGHCTMQSCVFVSHSKPVESDLPLTELQLIPCLMSIILIASTPLPEIISR
jgi:hypothetical protein